MRIFKMANEETKPKNIALTAIFASAVTTFALGLPMEFVTELFTFPFAHESALGNYLVNHSSNILVPIFDQVGMWFGIEPFGQQIAGLDTISLN